MLLTRGSLRLARTFTSSAAALGRLDGKIAVVTGMREWLVCCGTVAHAVSLCRPVQFPVVFQKSVIPPRLTFVRAGGAGGIGRETAISFAKYDLYSFRALAVAIRVAGGSTEVTPHDCEGIIFLFPGLAVVGALCCDRENARVVVADLSDKGGQETVDLIVAATGDKNRAVFKKTDVSKVSDS